MPSELTTLRDLDHVVMKDGRIYRVVGDVDSGERFLGYNVYSPHDSGDRLYQGTRYRKNFIEDEELPTDVLHSYELLPVKNIVEHHKPIESACSMSWSFESTIWHDLYRELVGIFGWDSVGIFGSSMFGFHLTGDGSVRKDVDFVVQGLNNAGLLKKNLPVIRENLGFTTVSMERQLKQYARYQRVFRNERNSIRTIIARRWSSLQLSEDIVTTIRLTDSSLTIPIQLIDSASESLEETIISGRVRQADGSNLFPRRFILVSDDGQMMEIYIFWWKFSTPVRDGDQITLCGSLLTINGQPVIRLTNFSRHWLEIR